MDTSQFSAGNIGRHVVCKAGGEVARGDTGTFSEVRLQIVRNPFESSKIRPGFLPTRIRTGSIEDGQAMTFILGARMRV